MKFFLFVFSVCVLCSGTCLPFQVKRDIHSYATDLLKVNDVPPYTEYYFTQRLDHFDFNPTAPSTFQQRYLICDKFWKGDGPIFFYTGNEGDIVMFYSNTGFMFDLAESFNALVLFVEHRYYGKSNPKPLDWQYLTTEQALADYAVLLTTLKREGSLPESPVVSFGGSYGGMLSAWFRVKYPHITVGSIAASAPIAQFKGLTSQYAFNKVVTLDFEPVAGIIREAFDALYNLSLDTVGKKMRLCSALTDEKDRDELYHFLYDAFSYLAMVDYPYPTQFLQPVPAWPVNVTIEYIQRIPITSQESYIDVLLQPLEVFYNWTGSQKCFNITAGGSPTLGDMAWDYQSCTEMAFPMGANGESDMFLPEPYDFSKFSECCFKKFGVYPDQYWIPTSLGGRNLEGSSSIFFSQGTLDPWSLGGVCKSISDTVVAAMIEQGAHHLDLRFPNSADPESVRTVREMEKKSIERWLST